MQRFINADPAGFDGSLNWYAYVNNSPLLFVDPDGELPILAVPLLMHAARIAATVAIRRAAPIAARFIARAATRSAAVAGRATANFGRSTAIRARNIGQAGLNQANFRVAQINNAVARPSSALRRNLAIGLGGTTLAGLGNELFDGPIDTGGFTGVDFGQSPAGLTLQTGIHLFDAGGTLGKTIKALPSARSSALNSFNSFSRDIRSTFSTPSFESPNFNSFK